MVTVVRARQGALTTVVEPALLAGRSPRIVLRPAVSPLAHSVYAGPRGASQSHIGGRRRTVVPRRAPVRGGAVATEAATVIRRRLRWRGHPRGLRSPSPRQVPRNLAVFRWPGRTRALYVPLPRSRTTATKPHASEPMRNRGQQLMGQTATAETLDPTTVKSFFVV